MKLKIKVTKEIQQKAMMCGYLLFNKQLCKNDMYNGYTEHCEVAEAVREIFPMIKVCYGSNGGDQIFCIRFLDGTEIPLPDEAEHRIKRFDSLVPEDRVKEEPYEFEVDVPQAIIDQIGLSEVHRILKESKTLELV